MNNSPRWTPEFIPTWLINICLIIVYWVSKVILLFYTGNRIHIDPSFLKNAKGPYIIAANHWSRLDPFLIAAALPWSVFVRLMPLRFVTKDAYIAQLWQQIFLYPVGCFQAKQVNEHMSGLDLATKFLNAGQSIVIFPEGKIVRGVRPQARVGAVYLAYKTKTPVIPVLLEWKKHRLSVYIGNNVNLPAQAEDLQPAADKVLDAIYKLGQH